MKVQRPARRSRRGDSGRSPASSPSPQCPGARTRGGRRHSLRSSCCQSARSAQRPRRPRAAPRRSHGSSKRGSGKT
eukprot:1150820-Alexandrium_andersonii.AAC.1